MKRTLSALSLSILCLRIFSQAVPNGNMETWVTSNETSHAYLIPQNWITLDQFTNAFNSSYTGTSVLQTTSMHGGQYAVLMQTAINNGDTVAGTIISNATVAGFLSALFGNGNAIGVPHSTRSANLQGYYKFTRIGGDTANISVIMTKWNTSMNKRDTLAFGGISFATNVSSYTSFSAPILYSLNLFPDTVAIFAGISGPNGQNTHVGTQFYLDDLSFAGTVPVGVKENANDLVFAELSPNPFHDKTFIQLNPVIDLSNVQINVYDLMGNEIAHISQPAAHQVELDLSSSLPGIYFYQVFLGGERRASGKMLLSK